MKRFLQIALLAAFLGSFAARADRTDQAAINAAAIFENRLICLASNGAMRLWKLDDFSSDPVIAQKLSRAGLTELTADTRNLWAADTTAVYRWNTSDAKWETAAKFAKEIEEAQAFIVVDGKPLLIFESHIRSPINRKNFRVPKLKGTFESEGKLRVLSIFSSGASLWIGTGNGEWGGELIRFNPRDGTWRDYSDALHYVTGIAQSAKSELIVSWSMSHFMADTLIRVHNLKGAVVKSYPELQSKYYQQIAYSSYDHELYGIEADSLVTINEGRPHPVAILKGELYEREPNAIGVAPAVVKIFPTAQKTVIVVPKQGVPWLVRDSKIVRLRD